MKSLPLPLILVSLLTVLPVRAEPAALSFLRTSDLPDGARGLQTASVEYRPANGVGPGVWLIGGAHLGTAEYFNALQERLDRQTLVLYEGIGMRDMKSAPGASGEPAGIQTTLANALGLKFQLDAIDYRRPSFVNSDLHVPELQEEVKKRQAARPNAGEDQNLDQLLQALQGTGPLGGALNQVIGLLGSAPEMRETMKLLLVEILGQAGELLTLAQQFSTEMKDLFDVILTQRNTIVIRDLSTRLTTLRPQDSVAIFYGAAHMDEIARRLRDDLHYVPVQTEWDTAFSATGSGINPAQVRMMIQMMRSQLETRPPATR